MRRTTKTKGKLREGVQRNVQRLRTERRREKERQQKSERYQRVKKKFRRIKQRQKKMVFKGDADTERYVWMPRQGFTGKPMRMVYVYPILCSMVDSRKNPYNCNISILNIAEFSGCSTATVQSIVKELEEYRFIEIEKLDDEKVHYNRYNVLDYTEGGIEGFDYSGYFRFRTYIIESGLWSILSNTSKKVYWVLREQSKGDMYAWAEVEGIDYIDMNDEEVKQYFANRNWDFILNITYRSLAQRAKIDVNNVSSALMELERRGLIERFGEREMIVNFIPGDVYQGINEYM